jgi:hypothetical protein
MHAASKSRGRDIMDRDEVKELHYIASFSNLGSILMHGILSHERAARLPHRSVASEEVQDIRRRKSVPGGQKLHRYANLYFHAHNPMMSRIRDQTDLIVIRVSPNVLDIPETVLTDGNAATGSTRFYPSPEGLQHLNSELIFAKYWTDPNTWVYLEKKRYRNAEVLVPGMVASNYIEGCYVDTPAKYRACLTLENLPAVSVRREMFF